MSTGHVKRSYPFMSDDRKRDIAVLVLSCDRYRDLWQPYFELFFRFWPDVPFRVVLLANEADFEHPRVDVVRSGPDAGWAPSLRRGLEQLTESHVLTLVEDAFFAAPVEAREIEKTVRWAVANGATACRMRPQPPADLPTNEEGIGRVSEGMLYRTSLFATLWRRDKLIELLPDEQSAWSFELDGHLATAHDPAYFATYKNLFPYIHGVEKGVWHRSAVSALGRLCVGVDTNARRVMSRVETAQWHLRQIRGRLLRLVPPRHRATALRTAQRLYRASGLRSRTV